MPGFKNWFGKRKPDRKVLPPAGKPDIAPKVKGHSEKAVKENIGITVTEALQALPEAESPRNSVVVSPPLPSPRPPTTPLEAARAELQRVTESFDAQVRKFQIKMGNSPGFELEVGKAALAASASAGGIGQAANTFQNQINTILSMTAQKSGPEQAKWHGKLASFVGALYPAVRLTLGVTADVAGTAGFLPLSVTANGIAVIFQVLDQEKARKVQFLKTLEEIEVQSSRLGHNKNFEAMFTSDLLQERATRLMIGIVSYLPVAMSYLCRDVILNVAHSLFGGNVEYREAEQKLIDSVRRYNEAIGDFTAECVAEDRQLRISDMKERHDEGFLQWISSSHWEVEAQLETLQMRYKESSTLHWAHRMDEFQAWLMSDFQPNTNERVLWIVGPPGVGKSTLAAYFLEFTRTLDSKAITAFFFIRSELGGLTRASEIVRTLAHQISLLVPEMRQALERLKATGFVVDDKLGIKYLFTKLLLEPLRTCKLPIHVILDGLDEVDATKDPLDRSRPSSEILFDCLYSIPTSRLLFLTRPQTVPPMTKHSFALKSIGLDDNKGDIESYVKHHLDENEHLKRRFEAEGIDPVQFFITHSNGIFLWVSLLLEQISQASRTVFQKFVRNVMNTPMDMAHLYTKIFEGFTSDQRRWVKEIFHWIIGPRRQLSIDELQCIVEWCLDDDLPDFRDFIRRNCGSIFIITKRADGTELVQTVHETLRAFISEHSDCPPDLHVTAQSAHAHVTAAALKFLSADDTEDKPIYRYLVAEWHYHLVEAAVRHHDDDILGGLYTFFHSRNLKRWVYHDIISHWKSEETESETAMENKALKAILEWLVKYEGGKAPKADKKGGELGKALEWRQDVVSDSRKLGDSVGKVSAHVWLFDQLELRKTIVGSFKLATKYYWLRENRPNATDREALQDLINTDFAALIDWSGAPDGQKIVRRNLDIAHLTLKQWNESYILKEAMSGKSTDKLWEDIRALHFHLKDRRPSDSAVRSLYWQNLRTPTPENTSTEYISTIDMLKVAVQTDPAAWAELGAAHRTAGQLEESVFAYTQATQAHPHEFAAREMLAETYRVKGEFDNAVKVLENSIHEGFDSEAFAGLGWAYLHLDDEKARLYFNKSIEANPDLASPYKGLGDFYNIHGEYETIIEIYRRKSREGTNDSFVWSGLAEAYLAKGDYARAVENYAKSVEVNPRDTWASNCLGDAYRLNKQYEEAIQALWFSIEGNPRDSWPWKGLAESYHEQGDIIRAIAIYLQAIDRLPIDYSLHISVGLLFTEKGENRMASDHFQAACHGCPLQRRLLAAYFTLPTSHLFSNYPLITLDDTLPSHLLWTHLVTALRAHGDSDGASRVIEETIALYKAEIGSEGKGEGDRFLWTYSSYSASRGFDPFEYRQDLPVEVIWVMLGLAYAENGNFKGAVEAYEGALKILPSNKWLWEKLGGLKELMGDQEGAEEARSRAEVAKDVFARRMMTF